jgi:endonuclease YncB( thermonuclease family)
MLLVVSHQQLKSLVEALAAPDFTVMHEGVAEKIRLFGIDCPEKKQPFCSKKYAGLHKKRKPLLRIL